IADIPKKISRWPLFSLFSTEFVATDNEHLATKIVILRVLEVKIWRCILLHGGNIEKSKMAAVSPIFVYVFGFLVPDNVRLAAKFVILHGLEVELWGGRDLRVGHIKNPRCTFSVAMSFNSLQLKINI